MCLKICGIVIMVWSTCLTTADCILDFHIQSTNTTLQSGKRKHHILSW